MSKSLLIMMNIVLIIVLSLDSCTVLTSDGYFVLRPQNSNTPPLHLTEVDDVR